MADRHRVLSHPSRILHHYGNDNTVVRRGLRLEDGCALRQTQNSSRGDVAGPICVLDEEDRNRNAVVGGNSPRHLKRRAKIRHLNIPLQHQAERTDFTSESEIPV